ncbi:sensor histidine kinase [Spirosoma areae]
MKGEATNQEQFFLRILISPEFPYRLVRYSLLWVTALLLIYRGFHFLATTIPAPSEQVILRYSLLSTGLFGGLTIGAYALIVGLTHRYILDRFQLGWFLLSIFGVHLVASELVFAHFNLFYTLFSLNHLPRFYTTNREHILNLTVWQPPFDSTVVWLFSFSLFYNYLLYAVSLKVFKDLFGLRLQKTELEKENLRLEFDFLKAQINPHFLFNTLNNLYSFSIRSPEKVADPLLKLADLMRYTLYETGTEKVLLTNELAFLTSYIELERIRHDKGVGIRFTVTGQPTGQLIPPLLLIVFVENAFKHGIQATARTSWVDIELLIHPASLILQVANSVPARSSTTPAGIGLNNVQKRLAYLYPHHHTLTIHPTPQQFNIILTLDLDEKILSGRRPGR